MTERRQSAPPARYAGRCRWPIRLAVVIGVASAHVLVACGDQDTVDPLAEVHRLVSDDDQWSTSAKSSATLASISSIVEAMGTECGKGERCANLLETAAWARVTMARIRGCTQPYVSEFRDDLDDVMTAFEGNGAGPGDPPALITC